MELCEKEYCRVEWHGKAHPGTGVVEEVFNGVHGQPRPGPRVHTLVVQGVHVAVQKGAAIKGCPGPLPTPGVHESVNPVKVGGTPEVYEKQGDDGKSGAAPKVRIKGRTASGICPSAHALQDTALGPAQGGEKHFPAQGSSTLGPLVGVLRVEFKAVQGGRVGTMKGPPVPETKRANHCGKIECKDWENPVQGGRGCAGQGVVPQHVVAQEGSGELQQVGVVLEKSQVH